jgi:DNA-binding IclR family transcriptional regulator
MEQEHGPNSIEKSLRVLLAFQADRPLWGVRELSTHLGFSPATVLRILQTLKAHEFVDQDPLTRQYRLGNIFFKFIPILQSTYPVTEAAAGFMKRMVLDTRETVHLNVIEGNNRVCVQTIESPQNLKASMPTGSRSPLYAGASSKCLLAFSGSDFIETFLKETALDPVTQNTITDIGILRRELSEIRRLGYASSLGERNEGLGSLSAPVFDGRGNLLASLSLAIPEIRFKDERHRELCIRELLKNAAAFSRAMGFPPPVSNGNTLE